VTARETIAGTEPNEKTEVRKSGRQEDRKSRNRLRTFTSRLVACPSLSLAVDCWLRIPLYPLPRSLDPFFQKILLCSLLLCITVAAISSIDMVVMLR